ncbi:activating signal cointegrator 1 complex subunit 1 isoform X1 [Gallus gallus]|uniref:activating signal cointegrator 1 complex subunit 1 isoform X1 n=1 Tax=Gallus gallus TaxID=9031 RepID=UPI0003505825|nr:activating signal cointegrator 1 complex subunit 1 isoform X1 [Gallus gallus]XP_025007482.1 activating signal cointegrator 1 complex subunit 1 isoform X1 [Gallus gallus]XP_040530288.1 activating signal cointegrator 1 complex subunit 1 isoform X1 [Gallus gallus]XP_040530289.1 activating signal cointegrator 1 complex subunit 1 isoform X1 [Gallus gallus]|eukprot:XP_025007481.1 activating signal cointegrator 1 complex subunit 1 isoform X1 [Gallus gallus]
MSCDPPWSGSVGECTGRTSFTSRSSSKRRRRTSTQGPVTVRTNHAMPLWWKRLIKASSAEWRFPAPYTSEPMGFWFLYIIGKKGETKKRIETETRTSISIPKPGLEGEIVITGQQRGGVISARTRIDVLLDSFRKKQPFTHFLSFALNQPVVQEKFLQFKEEVLEKCSQDHGVSSSLFQNPAKLHLTLGTLVLLNEQEIQRACDLLQQCKEDFVDQITGGKPLSVEVAGVEYMNDDPAMMDVLYAKVHMKDGSDKLQVIADQLVEKFVASGLMLREWDRVKLHATVMNTLFRKDPSGAEERSSTVSGKSSFKERESFNGRNILKLFENFSFGEVQLDAVLLSQRYSSDASGYYGTAGRLLLH